MKVDIEKLRKEAHKKEISFRTCWECNLAHEHLKKVDYPICCFNCGRWFYKGHDITEYPEEKK